MIIIPIKPEWLTDIFKKGYMFFRNLKAYNRLKLIDVYSRAKEKIYILPSSHITTEYTEDMKSSDVIEYSNITLSLCDIKRICFLFKKDYDAFKNQHIADLLNISTDYLSHENTISCLIHETTLKNLVNILDSNTLLTVGEVRKDKKIDKLYNKQTFKNVIKFDSDRKYIPRDSFYNEIDGVYFSVLFRKNSLFYFGKKSTYIILKPSVLNDYNWHLNYNDNYGIPELGTIFKKDADFIIDHSDFTINFFELVILNKIENLSTYIHRIVIPKKEKSRMKDKLKKYLDIIEWS